MARVSDYDATTFLNVDLDIASKVSLDPLVAAFGRKVFVHHVGRIKRKFWARVSRFSYGQSADTLTRELCAMVLGLPRAPRALWNSAISREFNVGIQAGLRPHCHEVRLTKKTVALVARLGGTIALTTYAPDPMPSAASRVRQKVSVPPNKRMQLTRSAMASSRRGPRS